MTTTTTDPVTALLAAIASGDGVPAALYSTDAVLDATVPMWRLESHGAQQISRQLAGWYADPGTLSDLQRTPAPGGEVVRFSLSWTEAGTPMTTHQVHLLDLAGGKITRHEVWCGGRWDAVLQAEIHAGLELARGTS